MSRLKRRMLRVVALVLVALLLLGTLVSVIFSHAHAEEASRDSYVIEAVFLEDAQALRISQRLVYTNRTGSLLDRVEFSLYGNMFRRQSALMYEADAYSLAFADGFAPGSMEFARVLVDGQPADWGMLGENEMLMRVACDLQPGQCCTFTFEYTLLLSQNGAFLGMNEVDWRLRGFYAQALRWEDGEFVSTLPIQHANYIYAQRADYVFTVTLPERYALAGSGEVSSTDNQDGTRAWTLRASGVRELCVNLGMRWREHEAVSALGTGVRLLCNLRGAEGILQNAVRTLDLYEAWFGALNRDVTLVQSGYALGALSLEGVIWLDQDALSDEMQLRRALAKQFFGYGAYAMPTQDAWLSDALCEYVAYLALEEDEGREAFLQALNRELTPTVQFTLPGGLDVTTDATLFTAAEYDTVVCKRGALVLNELRSAMGLENLLAALGAFYRYGLQCDVVGEYDFVNALDAVDGGDWEAFLTDWLYNISDYYQQGFFDWLD